RAALLHQLGVAAFHPARRHAGEWIRRLSGPGGGRTMSTERAVLAGGCFWGMQDLIRRQQGVLSTRVGYTGGDVPNATYRNHGNHAEAIENVFDPARTSYLPPTDTFHHHQTPTSVYRLFTATGDPE